MASVESTSTDEIVVENHLSGGNRCRQTCGTRLVLACCPNSWLGNWLVVYTTVQKFKIKHFSIFLTNPIRRNKIKYTKATDIRIYVELLKRRVKSILEVNFLPLNRTSIIPLLRRIIAKILIHQKWLKFFQRGKISKR